MKATGKGSSAGRRTGLAGLLAMSLAVAGCQLPVKCPDAAVCAACPGVPRCCACHVHLFFITGLDPLDYANLHGLAAYCHRLGFHNTYCGQMYHGKSFRENIIRIRHEDPESRFVLVGFSLGANVMRLMSHDLQRDNIDVDLLVYFGGNTLKDEPYSRPENVHKTLHFLATGYIWKGEQIDGAENYKYRDAWHFGSPTHPVSLEVLAREFLNLALSVPMERAWATGELREGHTAAKPASRRDEWDFLGPDDPLAPLARVLSDSREPVEQRPEPEAERRVGSRTR